MYPDKCKCGAKRVGIQESQAFYACGSIFGRGKYLCECAPALMQEIADDMATKGVPAPPSFPDPQVPTALVPGPLDERVVPHAVIADLRGKLEAAEQEIIILRERLKTEAASMREACARIAEDEPGEHACCSFHGSRIAEKIRAQ